MKDPGKTVPKNDVRVCVHFCFRPLVPLERCGQILEMFYFIDENLNIFQYICACYHIINDLMNFFLSGSQLEGSVDGKQDETDWGKSVLNSDLGSL